MPALFASPFALPPFRAVLFDLDGTLVRTFIDFAQMKAELAALSRKWGTETATQNETDVMEMTAKMEAALGGDTGKTAKREAYALFTRLEIQGCAHPEAIVPASELLYELKKSGVPAGIITRNCRAVALDLTRRMDLPHNVLAAREDTEAFKPNPAPVYFVCEKMRVFPADCVVVGDLWADVASGKNAGAAATIGIAWPRDGASRFALCPPDVEVASLADAAALIMPHLGT